MGGEKRKERKQAGKTVKVSAPKGLIKLARREWERAIAKRKKCEDKQKGEWERLEIKARLGRSLYNP